MGIAAIGNWLFNFAIGLFIPPAFVNIRWGLFLVFGILCLMAAVQFFFTYPEVRKFEISMMAPTNPSTRLVVRLLRRLNSCSAKRAHTLGRPRRVATILRATSRTLLLRKLREKRLPPSIMSQRRRRERLRPLRRSEWSGGRGCQQMCYPIMPIPLVRHESNRYPEVSSHCFLVKIVLILFFKKKNDSSAV